MWVRTPLVVTVNTRTHKMKRSADTTHTASVVSDVTPAVKAKADISVVEYAHAGTDGLAVPRLACFHALCVLQVPNIGTRFPHVPHFRCCG